ncbi:putative adenylyltransferase/sulfurtransferase MoeZ [Microbacterium lemovicicum]|uniref:Putative adenylyltransferase/sulfurtransferase MoeZ n=1 Tax=Microbacterium lemovicicum TaxID=1072463 RepID=A0A3S9WCU6_9MICO|nr:ThiF family adenylyltransferase [Microbacterium lemovicicum]AZS37895.1 putative adenylyltransferase/sulfurtransferase MoeZ [Microbacterium lemovicicum]
MSFPPLVEPVDALTSAERARTARHASLAELGDIGQRRLAAAHVAVIGAGGLGSPIILALAAAGVGTLTVIDDDVVELSNLQRQVIHRLDDVGAAKTDSAARATAQLSPETRVLTVRDRLTAANAVDLLREAHLVIDGSDVFSTREAVAAAVEHLGIPLVWGAIQSFDAQVTVFWTDPPAGHAPVRLSDLYPVGSADDAPTCAAVGVLGALCIQVGGLMAIEAIKLIAGIGRPLLGRVLVIDSLGGRQSEVALRGAAAAARPAPVETDAARRPRWMPLDEADAALAAGIRVLDVREPHETAAGMIPGSVALPLADVLVDPTAAGPGPVLVVCAVGARADRAAAAMLAHGIEAVVLAGGIRAWDARASADGASVPA